MSYQQINVVLKEGVCAWCSDLDDEGTMLFLIFCKFQTVSFSQLTFATYKPDLFLWYEILSPNFVALFGVNKSLNVNDTGSQFLHS